MLPLSPRHRLPRVILALLKLSSNYNLLFLQIWKLVDLLLTEKSSILSSIKGGRYTWDKDDDGGPFVVVEIVMIMGMVVVVFLVVIMIWKNLAAWNILRICCRSQFILFPVQLDWSRVIEEERKWWWLKRTSWTTLALVPISYLQCFFPSFCSCYITATANH